MKTALPLLLSQLIASLFAAALGLLFDPVTAYSLLAGGLICILPNTWYASSLYVQSLRDSGDPVQNAGRFLSAAYKGEAIKILLAAALFIGNPLGLLLLPPFIWLVNKLYIYPEEKALEKLFGDEFSAYKSKVGRWL